MNVLSPHLAPLLRPGETCWRIEPARRVAFLIDAAAYYRALRLALINARRQVLLAAWDFDPRVELLPGDPHDGWPVRIEHLLSALVEARPSLHIHVLRWQMPIPAGVRHPFKPMRLLDWLTDDRLQYRLDGRHPPGGCHHQKIVVVDDAVAFCGGMDVAGNRWDTQEHLDADPRRVLPLGGAYEPRHDVMAMVDGAAARALGDLVRDRWRIATGDTLAPCPAATDPWPSQVPLDCRDLRIAIARSAPGWNTPAAREIEALHLEAIGRARRHVYVENQYFTAPAIAEALARRLRQHDGPEVALILPAASPSWLEHRVMDGPRARMVRHLRRADRFGRLRVCVPLTRGDRPIIVHSKLMIVDDRLVTVGSANLNNRSMGFDTECNIALEAADDPERAAIRHLLLRLLAEHLDLTAREAARGLRRHGLVGLIDLRGRRPGRRLAPLPDDPPDPAEQIVADYRLLDPRGLHEAWRPWRRLASSSVRRHASRAAAAALALGGGIALGALIGRLRTRVDEAAMDRPPPP